MLRFRYRASDTVGKKFAGVVEAGTGVAAVRLLNDRGLMVTNLESEGGLFSYLEKIRGNVGLGDLATFTRQL